MVHSESGCHCHSLFWNVGNVSGRMHYWKCLITMSVHHFFLVWLLLTRVWSDCYLTLLTRIWSLQIWHVVFPRLSPSGLVQSCQLCITEGLLVWNLIITSSQLPYFYSCKNFFLPILYSFYVSVNQKLYWKFGKPQLEIRK